jgi:hypothetical protein
MFIRPLALCVALLTFPAAAQNNFTITVHGKPAGKASYSIEKTKDGYHVKSKVSYHLSAEATTPPDADTAPTKSRTSSAPGRAADFQFVEDYKLDANSRYAGGFMTNMVTLVNTSYALNKSHDQLFISQSQSGSSGLSTPMSIKPNFVLLPDYDPSALQALLLHTVSYPAEKDLYLALIPGKKPGEDAVPALWLTNQPDAHGTLDGKPLTLHHFILRLYKSQYDIVADETNTLMMASSTSLSAVYTRDGFVLISIK